MDNLSVPETTTPDVSLETASGSSVDFPLKVRVPGDEFPHTAPERSVVKLVPHEGELVDGGLYFFATSRHRAAVLRRVQWIDEHKALLTTENRHYNPTVIERPFSESAGYVPLARLDSVIRKF